MDPRPTRRISSGLSTDIVELALIEICFRNGGNVDLVDDIESRNRAVVVDNLDSIYMC